MSELGTALSLGALPLIATIVLDAPVAQVSLLAAAGTLAGAVLAVPLGPFIEFRRKRPAMIAADLGRFVALAGVPVAAAAGMLTYAQLCLVAVAQAAGAIAFQAASGAHLKALVPAAQMPTAAGRLEATFWSVNTAGPPLGGALIAVLGATASVAADAVTFLVSALSVRRIRAPEPPPPPRHPTASRRSEVTAGWRYIFAHRDLRALFVNACLFGAGVMATAPLLSVFMLRELGFAPWQYGLVFGISCSAGLAGALLARPLNRRWGRRRLLLTAGAARALPLVLLPFAGRGWPGIALITLSEFLVILAAGAFNPTFFAYRLQVTADSHLARVTAAWSISNRLAQPVVTAAAGLLATLTGTRVALAACAMTVLISAALLPWRAEAPADVAASG